MPRPKLFEGFKVFLHGNFILPTPPKEDLERLLVAGGARLLARRPTPASLVPGARATPGEPVDTAHPVVVYDPTCVLADPDNVYLKGKRQAYDSTWLLNCISCFSTSEHLVD